MDQDGSGWVKQYEVIFAEVTSESNRADCGHHEGKQLRIIIVGFVRALTHSDAWTTTTKRSKKKGGVPVYQVYSF
jgi:hypothetical protein